MQKSWAQLHLQPEAFYVSSSIILKISREKKNSITLVPGTSDFAGSFLLSFLPKRKQAWKPTLPAVAPVLRGTDQKSFVSLKQQLCSVTYVSTLVRLEYWYSSSTNRTPSPGYMCELLPSRVVSLTCPMNLELFFCAGKATRREPMPRKTYHKKLFWKVENIGWCLSNSWESWILVFWGRQTTKLWEMMIQHLFYQESSSPHCISWKPSSLGYTHTLCVQIDSEYPIPPMCCLPVNISPWS